MCRTTSSPDKQLSPCRLDKGMTGCATVRIIPPPFSRRLLETSRSEVPGFRAGINLDVPGRRPAPSQLRDSAGL